MKISLCCAVENTRIRQDVGIWRKSACQGYAAQGMYAGLSVHWNAMPQTSKSRARAGAAKKQGHMCLLFSASAMRRRYSSARSISVLENSEKSTSSRYIWAIRAAMEPDCMGLSLAPHCKT